MRLLPTNRQAWKRAGMRWLAVVLCVAILIAYATCMPGKSHTGPLDPLTSGESILLANLRAHCVALGETIGERNVWIPAKLKDAEAYIESHLGRCGYAVERQEYSVLSQTVANIEVELTGTDPSAGIVVLGAHYDSVAGSPGANDNGSGVAAVLELARLFADAEPKATVRFVAFVNEEPPFFQTDKMGSRVYARRCRERDENIVAMLSLETIGFYSDERDSQHYPPPFNLLYPKTGNFIGFVGNVGSRSLVRRTVKLFRKHTRFPSEGGAIPSCITGAGWSDHWSFWQEGYQALMVTDTAPFRYKHYHATSDTPDKIDYDRTARVVAGLAKALREMSGDTEP